MSGDEFTGTFQQGPTNRLLKLKKVDLITKPELTAGTQATSFPY